LEPSPDLTTKEGAMNDMNGARADLHGGSGTVAVHRLGWLGEQANADIAHLPHTVKILLENLLRRAGGRDVADDDVVALARWPEPSRTNVAFMPHRVLMQDFTGVPATVDLAAMRSAMPRSGGDPRRANPLIPVDL